MSRQTERENFILAMDREGVPVGVARLLLRHAASLTRIAELECSSEAADRDRVQCPGDYPGRPGSCLCRDYGSFNTEHCPARTCLATEPCVHGDSQRHGKIPRIAVRADQLERRILALLKPYGVQPMFGGDPRGAVVKLKVPSGRTDDWGQTGICVP